MRASETRLAMALQIETERVRIAACIVNDVLPDSKSSDDVRAACLRLIDWLTVPAELLTKRGY